MSEKINGFSLGEIEDRAIALPSSSADEHPLPPEHEHWRLFPDSAFKQHARGITLGLCAAVRERDARIAALEDAIREATKDAPGGGPANEAERQIERLVGLLSPRLWSLSVEVQGRLGMCNDAMAALCLALADESAKLKAAMGGGS